MGRGPVSWESGSRSPGPWGQESLLQWGGWGVGVGGRQLWSQELQSCAGRGKVIFYKHWQCPNPLLAKAPINPEAIYPGDSEAGMGGSRAPRNERRPGALIPREAPGPH